MLTKEAAYSRSKERACHSRSSCAGLWFNCRNMQVAQKASKCCSCPQAPLCRAHYLSMCCGCSATVLAEAPRLELKSSVHVSAPRGRAACFSTRTGPTSSSSSEKRRAALRPPNIGSHSSQVLAVAPAHSRLLLVWLRAAHCSPGSRRPPLAWPTLGCYWLLPWLRGCFLLASTCCWPAGALWGRGRKGGTIAWYCGPILPRLIRSAQSACLPTATDSKSSPISVFCYHKGKSANK